MHLKSHTILLHLSEILQPLKMTYAAAFEDEILHPVVIL